MGQSLLNGIYHRIYHLYMNLPSTRDDLVISGKARASVVEGKSPPLPVDEEIPVERNSWKGHFQWRHPVCFPHSSCNFQTNSSSIENMGGSEPPHCATICNFQVSTVGYPRLNSQLPRRRPIQYGYNMIHVSSCFIMFQEYVWVV